MSMTSKLETIQQIINPRISPMVVPIGQIKVPWKMNIFRIVRFVVPIAFSIAMSFLFSSTSMTKELTIRKEAIKTVKVRIMAKAAFCRLNIANRYSF